MKKQVLFQLLFLLVVVTTVSAKTVETYETPTYFTTIMTKDTYYYKNLDISNMIGNELISFEITVTGEFSPNTNFVMKVNNQLCSPSSWLTPNIEVLNYQMSFDCSVYFGVGNIVGGDQNLIISYKASNESRNIRPKVKESYYVEGLPTIEVHGTEYRALDPGKMFIQLLDSNYIPINSSNCYMSIYYPNNSPFKYKQKMSYIDEGLYFLDFTVPYMNGVYMASSYCIVSGMIIDEVNIEDDFDPAGTISGGTGWNDDWNLNGGASIFFDGTYVIRLNGVGTAYRTFDSNFSSGEIYVEFTHKTSSMENGEYFYVYLRDASNVDYLLLTVTNGDDDNVWKLDTQTLTTLTDSIDLDGELRFFVNSSNTVEGGDYFSFDDIVIDINGEYMFNGTEYQIVRGSGEVHVTSDNEYIWELIKGELYYDNFYEGFRQYYDIISQVYVDTEEIEVSIPIYEPFPCDHVLVIQIYNETSMSWTNVSDVRYEYNIDGRNRCNVKFDMDLDVLETYQVRTDSENYWKQKLLGDYQDNIFLNDLMEIACVNYQVANGFDNYTVPVLNASYENDTLYLSCLSFFNSFYHYQEHIITNFLPLISSEVNFTTDQMNFLESSFLHIENAGHEVRQYGMTIAEGLNLGNAYSLSILADPFPPVNPDWSLYFANISSSALLYYNSVGGQQGILSVLDEINYSINNIDLNLTGINITVDIGEIPLIMIGGTEYSYAKEGLVAVRLTKTTGSSQTVITGATCDTTILYPDTTTFVSSASMIEYGNGIYYYNFTVPSIEGVYIYSVDCSDGPKDYFSMNTFHVSPLLTSLLSINYTLSTQMQSNFEALNLSIYETNQLIVNSTNDILYQLSILQQNITSLNITSLYAQLVYVKELVEDNNDFSQESVFLITDSIVRSEAIQQNKTTNDIKQELYIIRDNIEALQKVSKASILPINKIFLNNMEFVYIFIAIVLIVFISGVYRNKKVNRREKQNEIKSNNDCTISIDTFR